MFKRAWRGFRAAWRGRELIVAWRSHFTLQDARVLSVTSERRADFRR